MTVFRANTTSHCWKQQPPAIWRWLLFFVLTFTSGLALAVDYGDAPSGYGNASHNVSTTYYLGTTANTDNDFTIPTAAFNGSNDDLTGVDDENGLTMPALTQGQMATVSVRANGANGYLQAWFDWNRNGSFLDAGEQVAIDVQDGNVGDMDRVAGAPTTANGTIVLHVMVPANANTTGATYARFRWSSTSGLAANTNPAPTPNGEIEDYSFTIAASTPSTGTATVPQTCGATFNRDFGTGTTPSTILPTGGSTTYNAYSPIDGGLGDGEYTLAPNPDLVDDFGNGYDNQWQNSGDHTGNTNGRMLIVNAAASTGTFYKETYSGLIPGVRYRFSAYVTNIRPQDLGDGDLPNVTLSITPAGGGTALASGTSGPLAQTYRSAGLNWTSVDLDFIATATSHDLILSNNQLTGSSGNDLAIDDISMTLDCDYGDAPDSAAGTSTGNYNTTAADNGPSHIPYSNIRLGASLDGETDGLPNSTATGDDSDGSDDEEGITLPATIVSPASSGAGSGSGSGSTSGSGISVGSSITVSAVVSGPNGKLQAWIDWNQDGDFADTDEQVATDLVDNGSLDTNPAANLISFVVNVPAGLTGDTFARFRWSTVAGLPPTGTALDGEVEDYKVTMVSGNKLSGHVFEDVNYGGGAGRSQTAASGVGVNGAKVELYNSAGALVATTTTANDGTNDGAYSFNMPAGNYYVRVVSDTVNSTRTGSNGNELAVQTFRSDGTTAVTNEVGGHTPSLVDSVANTGTETLNSTTFKLSGGGHVQSLQPVTLAAADISGVDFGFNFDTIVNTNDNGQGSLRQFILNSNLLKNTGLAQSGLTAGYETSIFQLTGTAPFTINPTSALPAITDSYTAVNAGTQAGTNCSASGRTLVVQLDGTTAGANMQGLSVNADHALIRGLAIGNYTESGIYAAATGTNLTVQCNNLGLKADGTSLMKNTFYGLYDNGGSNLTVGGTTTTERNIISGNGKDGLRLNGVTTALIQNNYIGTSAAGTAALSNNQEIADYAGIMLTGTAVATGSKTIAITDNVIAGNDKGVANTSNTTKGIKALYASFINITNNRIGTTPDGMTALPNTGYGIYTQSATDIMIGGTTAAERNIISGNQQDGVNTRSGTNRITIYGNYIGLGSDGVKAIGNANNGIFLADTSNALIGNGAAAGRNIIGSNSYSGIRNSTSPATKMADNYIGTDVSGSLDRGNTLHGVYVQNSNDVVVGGSAATDGNVVVYNKVIGVFTERVLPSTFNTNTLVENNFIGMLKDGETLAGNTQSGVETKTTTGVTVRNNLISGNKTRGIHIFSSPSTTIVNNRIGTNASGTSDKGNLQYGIDINTAATGLTINGNLVSGNDMAGIRLINGDATGSAIYDNKIGTNLSGTAALANTLDGIIVDSTPNATIGSTSASPNTISGNARHGILISGAAAQSVQVLGNLIGLTSAGTSGIANAAQGILVQTGASTISIGNGTSAGANKIAYNGSNGSNGIALNGTSILNVTMSQNSLYANSILGIDLGLDKVSLDDVNDADTGANNTLNFPIFNKTQLVAGNLLRISGCAPAGAKIELFEADVSPSSSSGQATGANKTTLSQDYGEGETYLGTYTEGTGEEPVNFSCSTLTDADGNTATGMSEFQWTFALPASVVLGDKLTATASTTGTGTSEFSAISLVNNGKKLSGIVFEDVNYGGGAGRSQATSSGVGVNGAKVELYNSTGTLVASTSTANDGIRDGVYNFPDLAAGNYYVRVVSDSVNSTRTGSDSTELAVQTFRTDATTAVTNEVGGHTPSLADSLPNTGTETLNTTTYKLVGGGHVQSLQPVTMASTDLVGVDFGFNFDTIVNTNDSGQGSLRQFILNSNLLNNNGLAQVGQNAGKEVSIFMIPDGNAHAGLKAGLANGINGTGGNTGAAFISLSSNLIITDANTSLDASTQTSNVGDLNGGVIGTGGIIGVDGLTLDTIPRPDIVLDVAAVPINDIALIVRANDVLLKGFGVYGYRSVNILNSSGKSTIVIDSNVSNAGPANLTQLVIGAMADGSNPNVAGASVGNGIGPVGAATITNNYIAFNADGIEFLNTNGSSVLMTNNELVGNGPKDNNAASTGGIYADQMEISGSNVTIRGNLVMPMLKVKGFRFLARLRFSSRIIPSPITMLGLLVALRMAASFAKISLLPLKTPDSAMVAASRSVACAI